MKHHATLACTALLCAACTGVVNGGGTPAAGAAASGAGGGSSTSGGAASSGETSFPALEPSPAVLARLTAPQYNNALGDLFGIAVEKVELEIDTQPHNFSVIGASSSSVTERGVGLYGNAAYDLASRVFADEAVRAKLVPCQTAVLDTTCLTQFVEGFGLRAFRRPLLAVEVQRYVALGLAVGGSDPWLAAQRFAHADERSR